MENIRKRLGQNTSLYPDLVPLKPTANNASRAPTIISVSSDTSSGGPSYGNTSPSVVSILSDASSVGPQPVAQRIKSRTVVISDSEDDELESPPFHPRPNGPPQTKAATSKPTSLPKASLSGTKVHPIHIPSNRDIPRPVNAVREPDYETFDVREIDTLPDTILSPADAEKAIRDLVTDVYTHDQEVSIEDATVDGFREGITLLPHQVIGRKWMAERESGKKLGGILADDMGLGKTIQTITRIVEGRPKKKDREAGWSGVTLVVCPVAVVGQWAAEIQKMAIGVTVIEHHGQSRATDPKKLETAHVVITSYSTVSSEYGAYNPNAKDEGKKSKKKAESDSDLSVGKTITKKTNSRGVKDALFRVKWWRIVLDEAHNIKNRATLAARGCSALDGKFRWCLTGTPMQNNVEELYSLIKFLRIRPLSDWPTFKEQIAQPVKSGKTVRAMKRLQVVLRAIMLRRTKDTMLNGKPLLELPDRRVERVLCDFDPEERVFYEAVEAKVKGSLDMLQARGNMGRNYTSMLILLLRLRQACNHPSLISKDYKIDNEAVEPKANDEDELADLMGGLGLEKSVARCQLCQKELRPNNTAHDDTCVDCSDVVAKARRKTIGGTADLPPESAKTRKIMEILTNIDERSDGEEKTIIFSQFTSMLDLIEPFLRADGIRFVRYDGSMNKAARDVALDKIKTSGKTKVILISFKAGSTGLNLTCCNNVILVDLWWNPALEDQAFDRAHRFGQTRTVYIYKLSIPGTVEERILELQEKKRDLAKAALSGDKLKNMRLGLDDLVALFKGGHDEDDE